MRLFKKRTSRAVDSSAIPFTLRCIGSGCGTGYLPVGSGTAASLAALLPYAFGFFHSDYIRLGCIVALFFIGIRASDAFEKVYGQDPPEVTVDEFVGMWIATIFLPITLVSLTYAFILFRIFDIAKPYPASAFNKRTGGTMIMLDDVVAGLYANVGFQILYRLNVLPGL